MCRNMSESGAGRRSWRRNKCDMIRRLILILTESCNLRCKYCYVENNTCTKSMSYDVIDASLKYFGDNIDPHSPSPCTLEVFGGEPLLYMDKVKYIIENFLPIWQSNPDNARLTIFSNATLADEDFFQYMAQYEFVQFNFSVDGNKECHDSQRIYPDGSGTYDDVSDKFDIWRKIHGMENIKLPEMSLYVLSPGNIRSHINVVEEFLSQGVSAFSTAITREDIWTNDDLDAYEESIMRTVPIYLKEFPKNGFINRYLLFPRLEKSLNRNSLCEAGHTLIAVNQVGDIYPCHKFAMSNKYKLGNVFNGTDKSSYGPMFKNIKIENMDGCGKCEYALSPGCMAQCIASCHEYNGSIFRPIKSICRLNKINFDASSILWDNLYYLPRFQDMINSIVPDAIRKDFQI